MAALRSLALVGALLAVPAAAQSGLCHWCPQVLPQWPSTYDMQRSTVSQPCKSDGYIQNELAGFGLVSVDWSNAKSVWAQTKPMNAEEMLAQQANILKAANPDQHVWVYRNIVKALPWFTSVREKMQDPAYSSWFLSFKPNSTYHVPACDTNYSPPLCSTAYHDQEQTPGYPSGDGTCTAPGCDCGLADPANGLLGVPCGEYLFDHRNGTMLREWLISEFILGPTGLGNSNISGVYLDDNWKNETNPSGGCIIPNGTTSSAVSGDGAGAPICDCDHSPFGGPTEIDYHCWQDMGLSAADVNDIYQGWRTTMLELQQRLLQAGGFSWAYVNEKVGAPSKKECSAWFRNATTASIVNTPFVMGLTDGSSPHPPSVNEDLATFLLVRGPYAWLGTGWLGCGALPSLPPALTVDYGIPLTPYFNETKPGTSGVFTREWSKASVQMDCNSWTGTITMKEEGKAGRGPSP